MIFNSFKKLLTFRNKANIKENNDIIKEVKISEALDQNTRTQNTFSFENKSETNTKKLILPDLKLLKFPSKNEKVAKKNDDIDEEFLEKVLMDFGVEGKIKKINYGPVVTLNEFEPAAGVKVSKIINLSEDIARNTSSESARISIIPEVTQLHRTSKYN